MTEIGENTLAQPVKPPLRERRACLAKLVKNRLTLTYGKWCRPRYNSAVATFCDAIANGRPYTVNDPSVELELLYIDDLVGEMLGALLGEEHRCGYVGLERVEGDEFCYVPKTDVKTLGEIVYPLVADDDALARVAVQHGYTVLGARLDLCNEDLLGVDDAAAVFDVLDALGILAEGRVPTLEDIMKSYLESCVDVPAGGWGTFAER